MVMFGKFLMAVMLCFSLVACASWWSSSSSTATSSGKQPPNAPDVGGRQYSSDFLFGQAASSPVSLQRYNNGNNVHNATKPVASAIQ